MPQVTMPRLSDSMEEGTIVRWLKADGDAVRRGDEIVEIETDKATMAYEAEADGTLSIIAAEGATAAVGAPIATIGSVTAEADAPAPTPAVQTSAAASAPQHNGGGSPSTTDPLLSGPCPSESHGPA